MAEMMDGLDTAPLIGVLVVAVLVPIDGTRLAIRGCEDSPSLGSGNSLSSRRVVTNFNLWFSSLSWMFSALSTWRLRWIKSPRFSPGTDVWDAAPRDACEYTLFWYEGAFVDVYDLR